MKVAQDAKDCDMVTHFMFSDKCCLISQTSKGLCEMKMEATVELQRRRLEWKNEEMEFMAW